MASWSSHGVRSRVDSQRGAGARWAPAPRRSAAVIPSTAVRLAALCFATLVALPAVAKRDDRDKGDDDMVRAATEFANARTAPGIVLPGAYSAAFASLQAL